ncbi:MAG TPA: YjgP/YjgQ family permease [Phaeodactylibacter sp.]|nr:YjgP/YjgQ family permease [Phaeodactylibacter sp.]
MKKIDLYIIKKYLATFFFTVLIFSIIAAIIDFSDKIEDYVEEDVTLYEIIFDYTLNFMLFINGLLLPLYALIAVVFFTSRLAYNSEIISILNAGVSFTRLLRPYMIAALLITGLHLLGNHILIPQGNKKRIQFEHKYIYKHNDKGKKRDVHIFIAPDTKVYISRYRKADSTANNLRIEKFKDNELVAILKAKEAKWQGPPNHWKLLNYERRSFNGYKETLEISPKGGSIDTLIDITPGDFVRYLEEKDMMVTSELRKFIAIEKQRGVGNAKPFEIEIHRRTAEPITILILTIIGVAVAARKVRGGMGLHLAIGIAIGAVFIFLSKFSVSFATNESLPAVLGVWLPNIFFFLVALILLYNAQK